MASSSTPIFSNEERLQAKLTLLANVAVGFVEGLQEVSGKTITRIEKRDKTDIELHKWYNEIENVNYYAISSKDNESTDGNIWGSEVEEHLKLPALFSQQCSKIVYCLLPLIRDILGDDEEFDKVTWSREYIKMPLVLFHIDENNRQNHHPLPFFAHDFIRLATKSGTIYALDFTGEQYGIEEWFQTRQTYYGKYVWAEKMTEYSSEKHRIAMMEEEGARMPELKAMISKYFKEAQSDPARKLNWKNFNDLSESEKEEQRKGLTALIREKIVEVLLT